MSVETLDSVSVLICGGGPCGLMLGIELGRRGIKVLLIDEKADTAFNPQANATQARTMEHYRRLGFAREIRSAGLPPDYPTDIAYFTRYSRHELARFELPSSRGAASTIRQQSGSWSAAELPHRVSQKFVERILRRHAETCPTVSVQFAHRLVRFEDTGDSIIAEIEPVAGGQRRTVTAQYLVGADGPRSRVREHLGIRYAGEAAIARNFMGGRMLAVYLKSPDFYRRIPHPKAWMYCCFNRERRSFMAAVDGVAEFAFHTQLRNDELRDAITVADAKALFWQAMGASVELDVLSHGIWTAGHALCAESFSRGRTFIGGDAAHLFTPAGGLGYNTAVEDAVNLGWKLAAVLSGIAPQALLQSYESERLPLAVRNTTYARQFADSMGLFEPTLELEEESEAGASARAQAGEYFNAHIRNEFNIPGVTFGGRYDSSPVIVRDGSTPPEDRPDVYTPTACPGGRAPHLWLDEGHSLFDSFGFEWTLLRLGPRPPDGSEFQQSAAEAGMGLKVVTVASTAARELYQADLALIRPDQVVAWRGNSDSAARQVLGCVLGG